MDEEELEEKIKELADFFNMPVPKFVLGSKWPYGAPHQTCNHYEIEKNTLHFLKESPDLKTIAHLMCYAFINYRFDSTSLGKGFGGYMAAVNLAESFADFWVKSSVKEQR